MAPDTRHGCSGSRDTLTSVDALGREPDPEIVAGLRRLNLLSAGQAVDFERLSGGVSSDIWKVTTEGQVFCVKRALSKLKVQADWFAPVERNRFEVAWYREAAQMVAGAAPRVIGFDPESMLCAMEYFEPGSYRIWKDDLSAGQADAGRSRQVGRRLGRIHAGSVGIYRIRKLFPRTDIFHAIRLEPYLEATAENHPDRRDQLFGLSRRTAAIRTTMIHGDVSPKNIFQGPDGPVFIDAECACMGDPAFDLAFCLNHLLLKCLWVPSARDDFLSCFESLAAGYLGEVGWEPAADVEARAASLLPGLLLARVDGKSPVEYIDTEADRDRVRECARRLLAAPPARLGQVADAWAQTLDR